MDREIKDHLRIKLGKNREAEASGRFAISALVILLLLALAALILIRSIS